MQLVSRDYAPEWNRMQLAYTNMVNIFTNHPKTNEYILPIWRGHQSNLASIINGRLNLDFLSHSTLAQTMVRTGLNDTARLELMYLDRLVSPKNKELLKQFKDTSFGGIPLVCSEGPYSANAVGQLYYFSKLIEQVDYQSIETIVEVGGGYGCFARIAKTLLPDTTYAIIDLPELLALQYFYLSSTVENQKVVVHYSAPKILVKGAINLIPVFLVEDLAIETDVFVSFFALSESALSVQRAVINKSFFGAHVAYLAGQIDGWNFHPLKFDFVHHDTILESIRSGYTHHYCNLFHTYASGPVLTCSYEIMASR
jgi:putative sugar O-methyltransferase